MTEFNRINGLRVLADILEEKEAKRKTEALRSGFLMSTWLRPVDVLPEGMDRFTLEQGVSPTLCGTSLCVAGFATIHAGWKVNYKRVGKGFAAFTEVTYTDPKGAKSGSPDWEREGRKYLGMEPDTAHVLFLSMNDDGEQAIEILERLCSGGDIAHDEWAEYATKADISMRSFEGWEDYTIQRDGEEEPCPCGCEDDE